MKHAVVKIGSSQYKVTENQVIEIEKISGQPEDSVNFDEILLLVEDGSVKIGTPFLENTVVRAKIISQFKGPKIRVATYKAKSRYRRVKGHRKHLTKVKIEKIETTEVKKSPSVKPRKISQKSA